MFLEEPQEKETTEEMEDTRLDQQSEELILDTARDYGKGSMQTYHIHIVSEEDTLESIVAMYQTDSDTLKRYNGVRYYSSGR